MLDLTPNKNFKPIPKQYFWEKKKKKKMQANLDLKTDLYHCLIDRADKPQGYSLHKPNETEIRDGKGQCSGMCNTHAY